MAAHTTRGRDQPADNCSEVHRATVVNLKEIAAVLGVTESRVCQLHSQAIACLRTKMRGH